MGVAGARQVFGTSAKLHKHCHLVDEFACHGADDVAAEDAISLGVGEDFDEAVGGLVCLGAAIGEEEELASFVGDASSFQFFLGFADEATSGEV